MGPGFVIAVGYMDPGNWASDLVAGSQYGYELLFVIMASNLAAILLQTLSIKLGVATERDLAQACRDWYSPRISLILWVFAEVSIIACDLAEVIGSAIALQLLFGIPLMAGVLITVADVLFLLLLQRWGFRILEALIIALVGTIVVIFAFEIAFSRPDWLPLLKGFVAPPRAIFSDPDMLYIAITILGATVMPHNLYLHSSLVQTRQYKRTPAGKKEAIRFAGVGSAVALTVALFVNAAILVLAAAVFHKNGYRQVADISDAYRLLSPTLGIGVASVLFACGLLAAGQNASLTGTMAGQIIMEGFLHIRLPAWLRRLMTRLISIVPAVFVLYFYGERNITKLLLFSQVILSMQLSFAVFPLISFTSNREHMGEFVNGVGLKRAAYGVAVIIAALNIWLVIKHF